MYIAVCGTVYESQWKPIRSLTEEIEHPTKDLANFDLKFDTTFATTPDCEINGRMWEYLYVRNEELARKCALYCWDKYRIKNERSKTIGLLCIDFAIDLKVCIHVI